MAKLKQSETVVIKRSLISFAPYNPRKKDKKVVEALKRNFKKVGFLGGIQWNKTTGNLIGGHKRLEALDLIYDYDGQKDYDVKVEQIELDENTEKEQNIFLNNKRVQGETDYEVMAVLIKEINIDNAGLTDYDINIIESVVPDFEFGNKEEIQKDIKDISPDKQGKEYVKGVKKKMKDNIKGIQSASYFCVTFKDYDSKAEFLESIGINGDDIYITGDRFLQRLNGE